MNPIKHVAIIMDGNGRWGLKKNKTRNYGHKAGLKTVEAVIKESIKNNIKFLTLYAFSTENWKRPKLEKKFLFSMLEDFLEKKTSQLDKNGIKLRIIGDRRVFSNKLKKILNHSEKVTYKNKKLCINLALNYGSKSELVKAFTTIKRKKISINEKNISENLYTKNVPDPDILIRTGNTNRLSNFLLWQLAYTEIFFEKKLWPDFKIKNFNEIIKKFKSLKRNFGAI